MNISGENDIIEVEVVCRAEKQYSTETGYCYGVGITYSRQAAVIMFCTTVPGTGRLVERRNVLCHYCMCINYIDYYS